MTDKLSGHSFHEEHQRIISGGSSKLLKLFYKLGKCPLSIIFKV